MDLRVRPCPAVSLEVGESGKDELKAWLNINTNAKLVKRIIMKVRIGMSPGLFKGQDPDFGFFKTLFGFLVLPLAFGGSGVI